MALDLVVADSGGTKWLCTEDFSLDMEFGAGLDNDFELSGLRERIAPGSLIWCPGTEYGGVVDDDSPKHTRTSDSISYHGRTWHGVLAGFVVHPDSGKPHVVESGDLNAITARLLERCGIGAPFSVSSEESASVMSWQVPRYADLYSTLMRMYASVGMRLAITCDDGSVRLAAVPSVDWGQSLGSDLEWTATRNARPVNHLTVLGKGEGTAREVVELYADAGGNVSTIQTLFGLDHRGETYELTSKEGDELASAGRLKLARYQQDRNSARATLPAGLGVSVGDSATFTSAAYGVRPTVSVTGLVVNVERGVATVTPKTDGKFEEDDID